MGFAIREFISLLALATVDVFWMLGFSIDGDGSLLRFAIRDLISLLEFAIVDVFWLLGFAIEDLGLASFSGGRLIKEQASFSAARSIRSAATTRVVTMVFLQDKNNKATFIL